MQRGTHSILPHGKPLSFKFRIDPEIPRRVRKMTENEKILSHGITRMNTDKKERIELKHEAITHEIIGAAFGVYRILGYGFLDKVSVC